MIYYPQAVSSLRPNMEFVLIGDDIEGITWHTKDVVPLTTAEVESEVERLEKAETDKIKADQAATAAAIAHAKSLGFTDSMISVMYPNLGV